MTAVDLVPVFQQEPVIAPVKQRVIPINRFNGDEFTFRSAVGPTHRKAGSSMAY